MANYITIDYGKEKMEQIQKSFINNGLNEQSQYDLMKSLGYNDDECFSELVLNDETHSGLIKGKLDTSHLVLKDVSVKGVMQKRWVDPNKDNKEHAPHGSKVDFEHKGEKKTGTVGSVTKTGEYAIRGDDGKTYNKHPHQFDAPEGNESGNKKPENSQTTSSAKNEIKGSNQAGNDAGSEKKVDSKEIKDLDEEGDEDQDINAKFKTYEKFVRMTAKGLTKSTIAYGGGGVGKTYTAMQQLKNMNNPKTGKPFVFYDPKTHAMGSDEYDAAKITGKATTAGLYKALYQHNDKLLLFDDCDEVLRDADSVNMFKGALDSTGDGTISNISGKAIKDDAGEAIPQTYTFTGRAIFISNLKPEQMPQPLKSRSLRIDLSMDSKQTIDRIKQISTGKDGKMTNMKLVDTNNKPVKYDHEDMDKAIKFMDKYKQKMGDINVRTLGSLVKIIHDDKEEGEDADDWITTAKHMVFSKGFLFEEQAEEIFKKLGVQC
jgi:hypothetical protein